MAEAFFDEHPLDEYFKETGDITDIAPGALKELYVGATNANTADEWPMTEGNEASGWTSSLMTTVLETLVSSFQSVGTIMSQQPNTEFVERFKYDVISSTLLSSALAPSPMPPQVRRRPPTPEPIIPGQLSLDGSEPHLTAEGILVGVGLLTVGFLAICLGYFVFGTLAVGGGIFVAQSRSEPPKGLTYVAPTLDALESLKASASSWDAVVNEAVTILELEERRGYHGAGAAAPSSCLRIALHSTLLTTHHQCDNVRPLLAALTSQQELSQLSEMYAPTPLARDPTFSLERPLSLAEPRKRRPSILQEKHSTWNGSYVSLAGFDTSPLANRKRDSRRVDLTSMFETPTKAALPTPPSSAPFTPSFPDVEEEARSDPDPKAGEFGSAALDLWRKRRESGASHLSLRLDRRLSNSSTLIPSPFTSRLTTLKTPRNPLSLSSLHHALHNALASKRFACAHLLALRFDDDDDDAYWENVRSVMALLTSTFEDAASRLVEALDEAERARQKEEQPSSAEPSPNMRDSSLPPSSFNSPLSKNRTIPMSPLARGPFAPMPSKLARFAAHVETMSSALDDAREQLKQCVASLREEDSIGRLSISSIDLSLDDGVSERELPSMQAYERLRREIGLALRECERGKAILTEVYAARRSSRASEDFADTSLLGEGDHDDDMPHSAHDSGDSDGRPDAPPQTPPADSPASPNAFIFSGQPGADAETREHGILDDVSAHLLMTATARHLPPPGIEQVFEADAMSVSFTRPRSKLSREERIQIMKARRESGLGLGAGAGSALGLTGIPEMEPALEERRSDRRGWGPGGEVIQELKDVIWKVKEQRQRLSVSEMQLHIQTQLPTPNPETATPQQQQSGDP